MDSIKPDSIVWVKLGSLYGWWPAIFQPVSFVPPKKEFADLEIQESLRKPPEGESGDSAAVATSSNSEKAIVGYARFFDDDKFDLHCIRDPKDIKPYSCPEKLSIIRAGLKRFEPKTDTKKTKAKKGKRGGKKNASKPEVGTQEAGAEEKKKDGLFDLRAKLAQFYKDVELAEVMTDNSPKVGEILQLYEIEGEDWSQDKSREDDDDDGDDQEKEEEEEGSVGAGTENSPTENRNPNSGSAGSKKRKQSETPLQQKKASKKPKS